MDVFLGCEESGRRSFYHTRDANNQPRPSQRKNGHARIRKLSKASFFKKNYSNLDVKKRQETSHKKIIKKS